MAKIALGVLGLASSSPQSPVTWGPCQSEGWLADWVNMGWVRPWLVGMVTLDLVELLSICELAEPLLSLLDLCLCDLLSIGGKCLDYPCTAWVSDTSWAKQVYCSWPCSGAPGPAGSLLFVMIHCITYTVCPVPLWACWA